MFAQSPVVCGKFLTRYSVMKSHWPVLSKRLEKRLPLLVQPRTRPGTATQIRQSPKTCQASRPRTHHVLAELDCSLGQGSANIMVSAQTSLRKAMACIVISEHEQPALAVCLSTRCETECPASTCTQKNESPGFSLFDADNLDGEVEAVCCRVLFLLAPDNRRLLCCASLHFCGIWVLHSTASK